MSTPYPPNQPYDGASPPMQPGASYEGGASAGTTASFAEREPVTGAGGSGASQPEIGVDDRHDVKDQSVGSIITRLSSDISKLMRQELALAKAELREEMKTAGKAGGMLAGAGFAAWMVAIFASVTLMWLLDNALDVTLAALIVTVLWAVVGGVLFALGRKNLREVHPKPEQTVESLKEDAQWLKAQRN